jgi:hypothetical protein
LVPRDKIKNQVSVPEWIKNSRQLIIPCLKGLFDSDGSISINRREKTIIISFKNASFPLAKDFKDMCESLNIHPQPKITMVENESELTGKILRGYQVTISAKPEIVKFLNLIEPMKWKFGKDKINKELIDLETDFEELFNYKNPVYNKIDAIRLKRLFEQLGTLKKIRLYEINRGGLPRRSETISKHIKKLFKEENYLEKYGENGYNIWYNNNSHIIIKNNKVVCFPLKLKKRICQDIHKNLEDNSTLNNFQVLNQLKENIKNSELNRLDFLLNESNNKTTMENYIENLIRFVRYIEDFPEERKHYYRVWRKLNISLSKKHMKSLIDTIYRKKSIQ